MSPKVVTVHVQGETHRFTVGGWGVNKISDMLVLQVTAQLNEVESKN